MKQTFLYVSIDNKLIVVEKESKVYVSLIEEFPSSNYVVFNDRTLAQDNIKYIISCSFLTAKAKEYIKINYPEMMTCEGCCVSWHRLSRFIEVKKLKLTETTQ